MRQKTQSIIILNKTASVAWKLQKKLFLTFSQVHGVLKFMYLVAWWIRLPYDVFGSLFSWVYKCALFSEDKLFRLITSFDKSRKLYPDDQKGIISSKREVSVRTDLAGKLHNATILKDSPSLTPCLGFKGEIELRLTKRWIYYFLLLIKWMKFRFLMRTGI